MPADTLVILLIWLFYALECLAWDRRDVVHFRTLTGRSWKIVRPSRLLENAVSGLALLFPFPPLGFHAPARYPRVAFSPAGVAVYVPESGETPAAAGGGPDHISYDKIDRVEARGDEVVINGRPFVRADSKAAAAELAGLVARIKAGRAKDREGLIVSHIRRLFDRDRIAAAVADFKEQAELVLVCANFLWLGLILGLPAFIRIYGFSRAVVPILASVLVLHLAIAAMAFRAHKKLFGRWDHSMLYTLWPSPFHSIRAADLLAKKLLAGCHPFAVAAALLPRQRFVAYARESLARIRHPLYEASIAGRAMEIDGWYKSRIIREAEETLRAMDLDPAALSVPETGDLEAAYAAFCPRCHALYEIDDGSCPDCAGMKLVPLKPQCPPTAR